MHHKYMHVINIQTSAVKNTSTLKVIPICSGFCFHIVQESSKERPVYNTLLQYPDLMSGTEKLIHHDHSNILIN